MILKFSSNLNNSMILWESKMFIVVYKILLNSWKSYWGKLWPWASWTLSITIILPRQGYFPLISSFDRDIFIQIRTMPAQTGTDNDPVYPIILKQVLQ